MKEYNQPREYFREKLVKKYFRYYTNSMKEFVLVTTKDCSKCKFIEPVCEEWCNKNWYTFKIMEYWPWMDEVTSVPTAMIWEDVILDYEWIIDLVWGKKSFY